VSLGSFVPEARRCGNDLFAGAFAEFNRFQ
jgi:hypothetical protein